MNLPIPNNAPQDPDRKFGFISIIGPSNVGKSTLLNQILGQKIAIVSPKKQTTCSRIMGILHHNKTQMVFVDTPGIFKSKQQFDQAMVKDAWLSLHDADLNLVMLDASHRNVLNSDILPEIFRKLQGQEAKTSLVLNKVDVMQKEKLLEIAQNLNDRYQFAQIFMISALKGTGVDKVVDWVDSHLPKAPWMYNEDQVTTLPQQLYAAEITREKLFLSLRQELPYGVAVQTESWEEFRDGSVKITQIIYVENANHKPMILGKNGTRIKFIGGQAREELTELLERKVHLFLVIKVKENWRENKEFYQDIGLDF